MTPQFNALSYHANYWVLLFGRSKGTIMMRSCFGDNQRAAIALALLILMVAFRPAMISTTWAARDGDVAHSQAAHKSGAGKCLPWIVIPAPQSPSWASAYAAISDRDIWAVGADVVGHSFRPRIERWNGTTWHRFPNAKEPSTAYSSLAAVAAISDHDAWAVGWTSSGQDPLIEHWNGQAWSVVPSPHIPDMDGLQSVAALSSHDVWAVGGQLIEHWNGRTWSIVSQPDPHAVWHGVTAISRTAVWAVGASLSPDAEAATLTERWDGTRWRDVSSAGTPGSGEPQSGWGLHSVSADSATDVWTVGIPNVQLF